MQLSDALRGVCLVCRERMVIVQIEVVWIYGYCMCGAFAMFWLWSSILIDIRKYEVAYAVQCPGRITLPINLLTNNEFHLEYFKKSSFKR